MEPQGFCEADAAVIGLLVGVEQSEGQDLVADVLFFEGGNRTHESHSVGDGGTYGFPLITKSEEFSV